MRRCLPEMSALLVTTWPCTRRRCSSPMRSFPVPATCFGRRSQRSIVIGLDLDPLLSEGQDYDILIVADALCGILLQVWYFCSIVGDRIADSSVSIEVRVEEGGWLRLHHAELQTTIRVRKWRMARHRVKHSLSAHCQP